MDKNIIYWASVGPHNEFTDACVEQAKALTGAGFLVECQRNHRSVRFLSESLGEYRIDWGPGYRLYVTQDGDQLIILFVGGTKKRQQSDIRQAGALLDEYKGRKAKAKKARS